MLISHVATACSDYNLRILSSAASPYRYLPMPSDLELQLSNAVACAVAFRDMMWVVTCKRPSRVRLEAFRLRHTWGPALCLSLDIVTST